MNSQEIMAQIQGVIDDAKTAVLATSDAQGRPHVRWVTPAILKGHPASVFMVTSPAFAKAHDVKDNPKVEWMFQTRALDKVINARGTVALLDSPSVQSEVLEAVGPRLRTFWHIANDQHAMVVLETVIEEATFFVPAKGTKETVSFAKK
ncbi:MAG: pyridoxamine 5'-phosphate oxidase family protein [Chitinivibrionales bacterium]|nr:pyridoxamine 5'-phosphate oxidase family protein [Chitinivibrionales bacterium]MBD3396444.1 pyridoxamine 5'-phosphate oxidase family protein [Chitinivibrionales bacterium]